jgi:hypothetical protein
MVSHFYHNHQLSIDEAKGHIYHNNEHRLQRQQKHEIFDDFETKGKIFSKF